jgi:ribosomal protein S18 acetylase RimI-like enzyme
MITIIKAEEKHITDICKLWWEFIQFHVALDPTFETKDNSTSGFENEFLRFKMKSENSLVLVALEGKETIGYAIAEIMELQGSKIKECGFINHLHVSEKYRRRGIGKKMYDEILKWLLEKNIKLVEVQLMAKNELARSFWKKYGFGDYQYTWYKLI